MLAAHGGARMQMVRKGTGSQKQRGRRGAKRKGSGAEEAPAGAAPSERLLHDLRVHQVEVEMQNRDLREANGLLEASRARYAELYDRAPVAYLTFDASGRIREANLSAGRLLSAEPPALIGRYFRMFVSADGRRAFDALLARTFATDLPITGQVRVRGGGAPRVLELLLAPFVDPLENVPVCHAAAMDVTIRAHDAEEGVKRLRLERQARSAAETASAMKEEFLAVVSHELRTPLSPMLMWLAILEGPQVDADLRRRAVENITACVRDQVALIDDLVDTARATHGKLRINRQLVDLAAVVRDVIERAALSAAAKKLNVRQIRCPDACWVSGDADRLRQVVANLMSNAIKFSRDGGEIVVALQVTTAAVTLGVRDEGEGIPARFLPFVFEPLRQRESKRVRRHGGLGLGLFIARTLVALHGGTISAESQGLGRGASFTITLPRVVLDREAADAVARAAAGPLSPCEQADGLPLAGLRVLVVDDHAPTRNALATALELNGARIATADSAAQGRAAVTSGSPDVLICDLAMPDEDGYAFMQSLRGAQAGSGQRRPLPALALSAHAANEDIQRALDAGFDRYLAKPVEPTRLVSIVAGLAGRRGLSST
jgi:PAS domain S-box-containing protein